MTLDPQIALITLLNVSVLFLAMFLVGRDRTRHGIKAPATTGNEDFERTFRAQQNSLEQTVMFLPVLWLAAIYGDARYAAWLGYVWVAARLWFVLAYRASAGKRGPAFMVGFLAWALLFVMAIKGVVTQWLA